MKVTISNPNNIVDAAFVDTSKNESSFSVYINTVERRIYPDYVIGGMGKIEYEFYVDVEDGDNMNHDVVTINAETEEEERVLERLSFECHNKDQLWYMFPIESVIF